MVNQTQGAPLDFKIKNDDGVQKNVVRVDSTERVGINTITPSEALERKWIYTSK